jgi:hypothetical protein
LANTFNFVVKNGITVGNTPVIASNGTYISAIANTGVQPGIYGNNSLIPIITVGADGRVTAISNTSVASSSATAAIVTSVDTFTANGTGQTFVLSQTPYNINATFVNINGATQQKSSYTLSGNTITLSEIVPSGTVIEVSTNYNAANTGTNSGALVSTVDAFTANGNTTIFTLSSAPVNKNYTFVNIDGIDQQKSTYSITGNVITFSTAPPNGTSVEITAISSQTGAVFTYNTSGTNGQVLTLQSGAAVWANTNLTTSIANTGIVGLITASQIANVANTQITGVLTLSQGGTGLSSAGASGNVLTSNGSYWISQSSNVASSSLPAGCVVQVANYSSTTTYTTTTQSTYVQGPQTGTFTPLFNTSKVLIIANFEGYGYTSSGSFVGSYYSIYRGSIASGTQLLSTQSTDSLGSAFYSYATAQNELYAPVILTYLDTPGGATTYSLSIVLHSGAATRASILGYNITLLEIKA